MNYVDDRSSGGVPSMSTVRGSPIFRQLKPPSVEAGDVVLVRSDPRDVPRIIVLSKATYQKMFQVIS
jgi:hypothetical protein